MKIAVLSVLALTACTLSTEPGMEKPDETLAMCGADKLQNQIGQPAASYDFKAVNKDVRILPPGSMMTMDHRPDRLNVELDDAGLVTRLWCG